MEALRATPDRVTVEAFLTSATFLCTKMQARLTFAACRRRQTMERSYRAGGLVYKDQGSLLDQYCKSGDCAQGREVLVTLGRSK
mgnify:CR=1 FL=1